jgi:hypothetical protein
MERRRKKLNRIVAPENPRASHARGGRAERNLPMASRGLFIMAATPFPAS